MSTKSKQTTENQQLKRRAYQRLVGAVVLLLMVMIILPLVFKFDYQNRPNPLQVIFPDTVVAVSSSEQSLKQAPKLEPKPTEKPPVVRQVSTTPKPVAQATSVDKPVAQTIPKPVLPKAKQAEPVMKSAVSTPDRKGKHYVQIIVYTKKKDAIALHDKLQKQGIKGLYIDVVKNAQAQDRYHLRQGPYTNKKDAEKMLNKLKQNNINAILGTY